MSGAVSSVRRWPLLVRGDGGDIACAWLVFWCVTYVIREEHTSTKWEYDFYGIYYLPDDM